MVSRGFRPFRTAAAAAIVALALAGCGDAPDSGGKSANGTLPDSVPLSDDFDQDADFTYALATMAGSWDPIQSTIAYELETLKPVYDRLLEQAPDGTVGPMLATEFTPADDGSALTLKLREGLTFSDGTPFNAEAVKFNLDRNRGQGSKIAADLSMVTGVEVVDEYTVKITVSGGIASLPTALTERTGVMVSPTAAAAGTLATEPVGIGPYVLESFSPGDSAVMTRSENYWDPEAQNVATFTWKFIPDDQTRYNAMVSGEVDGGQLSPDSISAAQNNGIQVISKPSSWFIYLAVNTSVPPFNNVEARKALNMAIDREAIADGLYSGFCTPQTQPFVEGSLAYSEKIGDGLDKYPYDPDAAKKTLEKLGISDQEYTMPVLNVTIYVQLAEVLQQQLKEVGMTTSVTPAPPTEVLQKFSIDKSAQVLASPHAGSSDPGAILQRMVAPNAIFNPGGLANEEIMKYATEAGSTLDESKAKAAYDKLAEAWSENPPNIVPICNPAQSAGLADNVSGVTQASMGTTDLRNVAVAKE